MSPVMMSPGEAALADLLLNTILILGAGAAIGGLVALAFGAARRWARRRRAARERLGALVDPWEWPHGY